MVTDTVAASYAAMSSVCVVSAVEAAALRKESKYTALLQTHLFYTLAFETFGPINGDGLAFIISMSWAGEHSQ